MDEAVHNGNQPLIDLLQKYKRRSPRFVGPGFDLNKRAAGSTAAWIVLPRRSMVTEGFGVHRIDRREVRHVGDEDRRLGDVAQ